MTTSKVPAKRVSTASLDKRLKRLEKRMPSELYFQNLAYGVDDAKTALRQVRQLDASMHQLTSTLAAILHEVTRTRQVSEGEIEALVHKLCADTLAAIEGMHDAQAKKPNPGAVSLILDESILDESIRYLTSGDWEYIARVHGHPNNLKYTHKFPYDRDVSYAEQREKFLLKGRATALVALHKLIGA